MILEAATLEGLSEALASASKRGVKVESVDLRGLNRIVSYAPEDMTVTVEAGITLQELQAVLKRSGQWLPLDPFDSGKLTVHDLLSLNVSGPRRFGYGTARDHVIGMRVVLADGAVIRSGGNVVKNVAGYDLMKLFIGARGTLGVIVEVTFKLRPLPEAEHFVQWRCNSLEDVEPMLARVMDAALSPVVLDLHNQSGAHVIVLGFAGAREDVEHETALAQEMGYAGPADLAHESSFRTNPASAVIYSHSVLPSRMAVELQLLPGDISYVARAGNGTIYFRGGPPPKQPFVRKDLFARVKQAFDPKGIFPEWKS